MANPVVVVCPVDVWTLVATNVTTGQIWLKSKQPLMYRHTYVMTGGGAPTDELTSHAFLTDSRAISAAAAIDVYIKAVGSAGKVIVEI